MSIATHLKLSVQEYLTGEEVAENKHEYFDGDVYAMAGGSEDHNTISGNIYAELRAQLKGLPCKPFIADMKVKAGDNFFYPDVMVICDKDDADTQFVKHAPVIIIEVLSAGTRKNDITLKRNAYLNIPSLQEYVLIEQDKCEIEVFTRSKNWQATYYVLGNTITFDSIEVSVSVEELYDRIENDDIDLFILEKQSQKTDNTLNTET